MWFQQQFWDKRGSLRVGILAADAEFFTTSNGTLFLNGTFGAFTLVGANLPDPPIFPVAAPGVRFAIQPTSKFSFQAGIYGGDSGGSQDENSRGTNFNLRSRDGALIFAEVAYYLNQSPGDRGLTARTKSGRSCTPAARLSRRSIRRRAWPRHGQRPGPQHELRHLMGWSIRTS